MWIIYNETIITKPKIDFWEGLLHGIFWLEWFHSEDDQTTPQMLSYPWFPFLAEEV